jgi:hypothetical protein
VPPVPNRRGSTVPNDRDGIDLLSTGQAVSRVGVQHRPAATATRLERRGFSYIVSSLKAAAEDNTTYETCRDSLVVRRVLGRRVRAARRGVV